MADLMGGLDDATLHALLGSVGDVGQLDDLKEQLAAARKLRETTPPETIDSSPSHIPNIAGQIGGIFDRIQGKREEAQAKIDRQAVYDRQAAQSEKFLRALQGLRDNAAAPVPGQAGAPLPGAPTNPIYN